MDTTTITNDLQFVSFYVAEQMYGLDIQIVKEVNPNIAITEVPLSNENIRGLVNIRGQIILVMDIAIIFGHAPRPLTDNSQLVILKTAQEIQTITNIGQHVEGTNFGDKPIAFLVDEIGDVVTLPVGMIEPSPPHLVQSNAPFVKGVAKNRNTLLIILNAEEMLNT